MASTDDTYPYDLGSFHRPISTSNPATQRWFDRGLIWTYGFNHEEAIECFNKAIQHDSGCAMAYWAFAYASGPNYNKPWEYFDDEDFAKTIQDVNDATTKAKAKSVSATGVERALVDAIQDRYPSSLKTGDRDFKAWNQKYAAAMRNVYAQFPSDLDVATLLADALMNITPWKLWDLRTGEPAPDACTLEAKTVLDKALLQPHADEHPGLLHLYIHLMEMSQHPESALPKGNLLRGLVPDSGHLNHMPTHLDIICGAYSTAADWNLIAIRADEKFLSRAGAVNFYTLYRSHDYHFRIYAAMFAGISKIALETVTELEASIPEELLRVTSPPMADWLEGFVAMKVHVFIRFGLWEQLLALEIPSDQELYCVTTATIHYGKGIAYAATNRVEQARHEQNLFNDSKDKVPSSRMLFNNRCTDILLIASSMLEAEITYRAGMYPEAFKLLDETVLLYDELPYDEPWGWMQPTRHVAGALLLEQGEVEKALGLFRADLGLDRTIPRAMQHPGNVWALHGYKECLDRLGRGEEAGEVEVELRKALEVADVRIGSSCFCRNQK